MTTPYDRENRLDLRVRTLEATIRRQDAYIADRLAEIDELRARLAAAIDVAVALEGEIDACPQDVWHFEWAYREAAQ